MKFGNLAGVLAADLAELSKVDGIKSNSAILLKLVNWMSASYVAGGSEKADADQGKSMQLTLFESPIREAASLETPQKHERQVRKDPPAQNQAQMFWNPHLKEAIEMLPRLPETDSLEEIRAFLRKSLHFSAQETRQRAAEYIARRMFPSGQGDRALRLFARVYAGRQELRDACFYRFCLIEPFMVAIMADLLLPTLRR